MVYDPNPPEDFGNEDEKKQFEMGIRRDIYSKTGLHADEYVLDIIEPFPGLFLVKALDLNGNPLVIDDHQVEEDIDPIEQLIDMQEQAIQNLKRNRTYVQCHDERIVRNELYIDKLDDRTQTLMKCTIGTWFVIAAICFFLAFA